MPPPAECLFVWIRLRPWRDKFVVLDVAIVEQFCLLHFVSSLLGQDEREPTVAFPDARLDVNPDVVVLARLHMQVDARRLVIRTHAVLSGIEFHDEEAAILHACELTVVRIDGRFESGAYGPALPIDVQSHLFDRNRSTLLLLFSLLGL